MQFASHFVYKEKYLNETDLRICNEQSALVDFLVMQESSQFVGVGISTFSFYLAEARLLRGLDPIQNELIMMPLVGSDELFFRTAVVAIETRLQLSSQGKLRDICRRPDLVECYSDKRRRRGVLEDLEEDLRLPPDPFEDPERPYNKRRTTHRGYMAN